MGFFSKLFNTLEGSTNNEEVLSNKCKVLIKVENITNKEIIEKVSNLECLEGTEETIRLEFIDDGIIHIIHNDFGIIANVPVEKVNKTQKIIKENKRYAIRYELKYTKKSESVTLIMRLYEVMTAKEAQKIQQEKEKLKKQKANLTAREQQNNNQNVDSLCPLGNRRWRTNRSHELCTRRRRSRHMGRNPRRMATRRPPILRPPRLRRQHGTKNRRRRHCNHRTLLRIHR